MKARVHAADMTGKVEEMRVEMDEAYKTAETAEKDLKAAKQAFDQEMSEIKRNHEKRASTVLVLRDIRTEKGSNNVSVFFKSGFRFNLSAAICQVLQI